LRMALPRIQLLNVAKPAKNRVAGNNTCIKPCKHGCGQLAAGLHCGLFYRIIFSNGLDFYPAFFLRG
jgi:hypothetical protein